MSNRKKKRERETEVGAYLDSDGEESTNNKGSAVVGSLLQRLNEERGLEGVRVETIEPAEEKARNLV